MQLPPISARATMDGVGLGLHIVRKLVRAYRGMIDVHSGQSTVTFTVRLPEATEGQSDVRAIDLNETSAARSETLTIPRMGLAAAKRAQLA